MRPFDYMKVTKKLWDDLRRYPRLGKRDGKTCLNDMREKNEAVSCLQHFLESRALLTYVI
jgi:hypothetical protein